MSPSPPRRTGSATILLGLTRVPVAIYPGVKDPPRISFTTLCARHAAKANQCFICSKDSEVLPRENLAKGYELGKDRFLVVDDQELKDLEPDPEIRIDAAFPLIDCDPRIWTGQVQYLAPDIGPGPVTDIAAARDFARLSGQLEERGLVAVGRWSTRGADRLVGLYSAGGRIVLLGMRRAGDEVRDVQEIAAAGAAEPGGEIGAILKRLTVSHLDTGAYPDERYNMTVALLQAKAEAAAREPLKKKPRNAAR
ncbi:MAG: hypothetical protein JXA90_09105 [Planctomycetes bacterium]|nr:hypothetical protein [Planctomycetota bacterium]